MDKPRVGDQLHMHRARSTVAGDLTHTDRLRDAIGAMYASGSDAQALYEQAAKTLKREPEAMMVAIIAAYGGCQPRDYSQRQALVQAAAVIGSPVLGECGAERNSSGDIERFAWLLDRSRRDDHPNYGRRRPHRAGACGRAAGDRGIDPVRGQPLVLASSSSCHRTHVAFRGEESPPSTGGSRAQRSAFRFCTKKDSGPAGVTGEGSDPAPYTPPLRV
jgi:hypothetical protein